MPKGTQASNQGNKIFLYFIYCFHLCLDLPTRETNCARSKVTKLRRAHFEAPAAQAAAGGATTVHLTGRGALAETSKWHAPTSHLDLSRPCALRLIFFLALCAVFRGAIMGGQHNGNEGRGFGGSSDSFYGGGAPADTSHFPHGHSGPQSGALKRPASPHELHGTSQNGRAAAQLPPPVGTSQEHLPEGLWTCPGCNWRNHPQSAACGGGFPSYGCGMPRPLDGAAVSTRTPAPTLASDSSGPSRAAAPVPAPSPRAPSNPAPSDGVRAQGASQSARPSRWSNAVVPPKEAEAKPIPGPSAPPGAPPGRGAGRGSASVLPAWMTSGLATSSGPRPADTSAQNAVTSQYGLGSHSHANFMPSGQDVSNNANFANRGSPLSNAYAATGLASPRTHGLSNQGLSPGPNQIGHHSQAIGISQQGTTAAPVRSAAKKGGSWGAATGKSCSEVSSSKRIKLEE